MMRRLRLEMRRRLLGNGYCNRHTQLDCGFETVCETCVHFGTGTEAFPSSPASATTPPSVTSKPSSPFSTAC